jgi:hypothetical protein
MGIVTKVNGCLIVSETCQQHLSPSFKSNSQVSIHLAQGLALVTSYMHAYTTFNIERYAFVRIWGIIHPHLFPLNTRLGVEKVCEPLNLRQIHLTILKSATRKFLIEGHCKQIQSMYV